MTATSRKLLERILALPEAERLEIATELLASVEGPVPAGSPGSSVDDEWDHAWLTELERRSQAAAARQTPASTWEEARERVLEQLKTP